MIARISSVVDLDVIIDAVASYVPTLVASLLLLIVFWVLFIIAGKLADKGLNRARVPDSMQGLIRRFLKYGIAALAILTVANQMGFNITAMVTGLGIAGLAISLAAQDTITNIISGITLAIDRPFGIGDWVQIGDMHAQVTTMRLRTTVLTTFDNETMVVPNRDISASRIINYTLTERIRVRVPLGIAYKESIDAAREIMLGTTAGDERILSEPPPLVIVQQLGDSSVDMELRFWTKDPWDLFSLKWEYVEKCKKALDEAGIEIPFPHLQLFLEKSTGLDVLSRPGT